MKQHFFEMKSPDLRHIEDQENFKRLCHLHLCPHCKRWLIEYSSCQIAFKIPPTVSNQESYGIPVLYSKHNWTVVHGPSCVDAIRKVYVDNPGLQMTLAVEIIQKVGKGRGYIKRLKLDTLDAYNHRTLKLCGFDPNLNLGYWVYPLDKFFPDRGIFECL
jgi:hypothetical protein